MSNSNFCFTIFGYLCCYSVELLCYLNVDKISVILIYNVTNIYPMQAYNGYIRIRSPTTHIQTLERMVNMDKQFIKRLHTLNRRDELRSRLLIEGVKLALKRKKKLSLLGRIFKNKKKPVIAKGWN